MSVYVITAGYQNIDFKTLPAKSKINKLSQDGVTVKSIAVMVRGDVTIVRVRGKWFHTKIEVIGTAVRNVHDEPNAEYGINLAVKNALKQIKTFVS